MYKRQADPIRDIYLCDWKIIEITVFSCGYFFVLNGFCRTAADTCHAMGAVFAPDWTISVECYIIEGTQSFAKAALCTLVGTVKALSADDQFIKQRIDQTAFQFAGSRRIAGWEGAFAFDGIRSNFQREVCIADDFGDFRFFRSLKKRDIIFGHFDHGTAHEMKTGLFAKLFGIFFRVSDTISAGQDLSLIHIYSVKPSKCVV